MELGYVLGYIVERILAVICLYHFPEKIKRMFDMKPTKIDVWQLIK